MEGLKVSDANLVIYVHPSKGNKVSQAVLRELSSMLLKIGRRPLLLTSVAGMILSLTIIDHAEKKLMWAVVLCISMVLTFVASFSIGMGPITWVYSSEIFPLKLRAQGTSMGVAVNRVTSGVLSMTFLSLYKAITIGGAFFLFAAVATVAWVFFYTTLPETQGRTLEDLEGRFGNFSWKSAAGRKENGGVQLAAAPNGQSS